MELLDNRILVEKYLGIIYILENQSWESLV